MSGGRETAFRWSLVCLAAVMVAAGVYTQSWKKMFGTYIFGMLGIAGLLLPDWDFFDRPVSQWCTPVYVNHQMQHPPPSSASSSTASTTTTPRFRIYPIRSVIYTLVYGFALYKWWTFISSN